MRLLELNDDGEFSLTTFSGDDVPRYAILSHTWGADTEEITLEDLINGTGKGKVGYYKIRSSGEQARRDSLKYFWVDTCCIDKSNQIELTEAINSMFGWYHSAAKCYVYLSDVPRHVFDNDNESHQLPWESAFRKSKWFTRGWTLPELIAPKSVEFFSKDWKLLGTKSSLEQHIREITAIPNEALRGAPLSEFSVAKRMSWAERRETTRNEDQVYSLLGIFDVHMPLIYGEGKEHAFKRLQEVINEYSKGPPIGEGANVKAVDKDGRTPLHNAARFGSENAHFAILGFIREGANVKAVNKDGRTPLHDAVRFNSDDAYWAILKLIQNGADVKAVDKDGRTPLHDTAQSSAKYIDRAISELIKNGADVKAVDKDGRTPLHDAAQSSAKYIDRTISELIKNGADAKAIDKDGRTPLHDAARFGSENAYLAMSKLIQNGADAKAVDKDGRTPLHDAARFRSENAHLAISKLIQNGADVEAVDKDGRTPLHAAVRFSSEHAYWAISKLIREGADVNAVDKDGRTPLHDAAQFSSERFYLITSELIQNGADVKAVDKDGRTPLHDAVRSSSKRIYLTVLELIQNGADVKAVDKDGRTPLHDAAQFSSEHILAIVELIQNGADVKAVDKDGRTPLHDAAQFSSEHILAIVELIQNGADVEAVDKDGRTPLYYSAEAVPKDAVLGMLSAKPQFIHSKGKALWRGLRTYVSSKGVISDILTISRLNSPGDFFIARSVSGILEEYYPKFGLGILKWITKVCEQSMERDGSDAFEPFLISQNPFPQTEIHQTRQDRGIWEVESPPVPTETTGIASAQEIIVQDTTYCRIRGHLEADQLTWELSSNSKEFAIEMTTALTWVLLALQSPPQDANGIFSWTSMPLDIGFPESTEFRPPKTDSYCWTNLFRYVCIAQLPLLRSPLHSATEGLEIDFRLLLDLAAVDRKIETEDGSILFGFDTALIPLAPPERRRWHFLVTKGRQITPARVKKAFSGSRLQDKIEVDYTGIVYVGWCATPVVTIGTKDSDKISPNDISMSSGISGVRKYEESVERSSAKDASFLARIGFLGSSIGAIGGSKRETKFKLGPVIAKRTLQGNFEGIITSAQTTPCILWDQSVEKSWLIPASSVLLFASLRYITWKGYSFKSKQPNGDFEPATVFHASTSTDLVKEASLALRKNQLLWVNEAHSETINDNISFEDIVKDMWNEMSEGEDVCRSCITGLKIEKRGFLIGYDMNEAICRQPKQLRSLPINDCMKSWQALALLEKTQVIFCKEVGQVLRCHSSSESVECCMQTLVKGTLSCLFQNLRTFYGECWNMPSNLSFPLSLPIEHDYEWILNGCNFFQSPEYSHCSSCLQSINPREPQKKNNKITKKKNLQMEGRPKESGDAPVLSSPRRIEHLVITFGSRKAGHGCE